MDICRKDAFTKGTGVLLEGENGCEIVEQLLPTRDTHLDYPLLLAGAIQEIGPDEIIMYKPRWGAFFNTPLENYLRGKGINTLIITGCNFPNCPRTTIYEASERDFRVVAVKDAISGIYDLGIRELEDIGIEVKGSKMIAEEIKNTK